MADPERIILGVEDDEQIRGLVNQVVNDVRDTLGRKEAVVFLGSMASFNDAVHEAKEHEKEVPLAVFDLDLPDSTITDTLTRIAELENKMPDTRILVVASTPLGSTKEAIEAIGRNVQFIGKPFDIDTLQELVTTALTPKTQEPMSQ